MNQDKLMELLKKKKAALKTKDKTTKPKPGTNRYVLLRGWREGDVQFFHEFGQHYIKDAADQIQAVYPCQEAIFGKPCPICQHLNHAVKEVTDDSVIELLKNAKGKQSFLLNVLALDGEDANTPVILEVTKTVFTQILDLCEEWGPAVFDEENPQIITITRDGKGLNTKYAVQVSPKKYAVPKSVYEKLANLDEYVDQANEENERRARAAIDNIAGVDAVAPASADRPRTTEGASGEFGAVATSASPAMNDELDDLLGGLPDDEAEAA